MLVPLGSNSGTVSLGERPVPAAGSAPPGKRAVTTHLANPGRRTVRQTGYRDADATPMLPVITRRRRPRSPKLTCFHYTSIKSPPRHKPPEDVMDHIDDGPSQGEGTQRQGVTAPSLRSTLSPAFAFPPPPPYAVNGRTHVCGSERDASN